MTVLWFVNLTLPQAAEKIGLPINHTGGWLTGMINNINQRNIQIFICSFSSDIEATVMVEAEEATFIVAPLTKKKQLDDVIKGILRSVSPDIVHINGTEYPHSESIIRLSECPVTVSIQGLVYKHAEYYYAGLPSDYKKVKWIKRVFLSLTGLSGDFIFDAQKDFENRGKIEKQTIKLSHNLIGRTGWDRKFTAEINPDANYFHCNETLRPEFYTDSQWDYFHCVPHSIFVSQGHYPIKGFHRLLQILPDILKTYPDTTVYVTGNAPLSEFGALEKQYGHFFYEYPSYLSRLIRKNGLEKNIVFLGSLSAKQMREQYLRCNIFLLCSAIENSPNALGEAMILGTPCVAADVGGVADMLRENIEGLLYPFDDLDRMRSCIEEMFSLKKNAGDFGRMAAQHAKATHDGVKNARRLMEIYKEIRRQSFQLPF